MKEVHNNKPSDGRFGDVASVMATVVILASSIVMIAMKLSASTSASHLRSDYNSFTPLIYGRPKGDVRPVVALSQGGNWDTCVYFGSMHPITNDWWLSVTNRIGCQLHLWGSDGSEVYSKKRDISAAFHFEKQTTMSNLLKY